MGKSDQFYSKDDAKLWRQLANKIILNASTRQQVGLNSA